MKNISILSLVAAAGLFAGCASNNESAQTSAMTINQLPQPVQTTVRNEIGDRQISSIKEETKDGQTAYKVDVERQGMYPMHEVIIVSADGSILKESRKLAEEHTKMTEPSGSENNNMNKGNDLNNNNSSVNNPTTGTGTDQTAPGTVNPGLQSPSSQPNATNPNGQVPPGQPTQ